MEITEVMFREKHSPSVAESAAERSSNREQTSTPRKCGLNVRWALSKVLPREK